MYGPCSLMHTPFYAGTQCAGGKRDAKSVPQWLLVCRVVRRSHVKYYVSQSARKTITPTFSARRNSNPSSGFQLRFHDPKCRWPNKKQDTSELSLNRTEKPPIGLDFKIKFECKISTRISSVGVKYSMRDLICDVINYCASNFAMEKISVYDQS